MKSVVRITNRARNDIKCDLKDRKTEKKIELNGSKKVYGNKRQ